MSSVFQLTPLQKRRRRGAFTLLILSIASLIGFGFLQKKSAPVTYKFVMEDEWVAINEWTLDSRTASYSFSIAAIMFSIWAIFEHRRNIYVLRHNHPNQQSLVLMALNLKFHRLQSKHIV